LGFVLAVTGAIGSGKTTLAARIAAESGALHLSSDEVRASLSHRARRSGARVFSEFHRRFERALQERRSVILDSTGMSSRFRALIRAYRAQIVHVHLLLSDPARFEQRESRRADRPAGPLSLAAFHHSQAVAFDEPPDIIVRTDDLTPQAVYDIVSASARLSGMR
jgi:predicted kinase